MRTNEIVRERCGEKSKEIWHREGEILGYTQCVESAREKVALVHKAFEAFFGDERTHAGVVTGLGPVEVTTPPSPVMKMDGGLRAVDAVALKANLDPEDVAKVTALLGRVLAAEQRAAAAEASLAQIRARDERSRLAVANAARDPRYAGSGRLIDLDALDLAKSWAPEDLAKVEALLVRVTPAEGRAMSAEARADLADERAKEKNDWPVAFRQPGERIPLEALRPEDFREGETGTSIYGLVVRKTLAEARVVELEAENARLREQAVSAGERASCLGDRCGTLEAEAADLKRQLKARR